MKKFLFLLILVPLHCFSSEFLVKFDPSASIDEFKEIVGDGAFRSFYDLTIEDESFLNHPIALTGPYDFEYLNSHPLILRVQKNYIYKTQGNSFPNDPGLDGQWAVKNKSMGEVWEEVTNCEKLPIAILDTGVNFSHEDLRDAFWQKTKCRQLNGQTKSDCRFGKNFIEDHLGPDDFNGHGTYLASLIGAVGDNSRGISGLCWKSQIMAIKVLNNFGVGKTLDIVRGIKFAVDNGAKILNLSFGRLGYKDLFLKEALINASTSGVLIVTSAGNGGHDLNIEKFTPCSFNIPGLICVASLDSHSDLTDFSNYGSEVVHLAAPGKELKGAGVGLFEESVNFDLNLGSFWKLLEEEENCLETPSPTMVSPPNFCDKEEEVFSVPSIGSITSDTNFDFSYFEYSSSLSDKKSKIELKNCEENECQLNLGLLSGPLAIWDMTLKGLKIEKNRYTERSGTSVSAGYVSGMAALLWSYNTNFSRNDLKTALIEGGRKFEHLRATVKDGAAIWPSDNIKFLKNPSGIKAEY